MFSLQGLTKLMWLKISCWFLECRLFRKQRITKLLVNMATATRPVPYLNCWITCSHFVSHKAFRMKCYFSPEIASLVLSEVNDLFSRLYRNESADKRVVKENILILLARAKGCACWCIAHDRNKSPRRCDKWSLERIKTLLGFWNKSKVTLKILLFILALNRAMLVNGLVRSWKKRMASQHQIDYWRLKNAKDFCWNFRKYSGD